LAFLLAYRIYVEIKLRDAVEKSAFHKKTLSTSKLGLNLRKNLVKCYLCCTVCMALKLGHFGR
jgi:hypothetical protein